jgi:hypothetical protein
MIFEVSLTDPRELKDLAGIGGAMLRDFDLLGVESVSALARHDPDQLYLRLCDLTGRKQDICVLDVFRCAVAQARDPGLTEEQSQWWWWSRQRRAGKLAQGAGE